jgi:hypothetical protein
MRTKITQKTNRLFKRAKTLAVFALGFVGLQGFAQTTFNYTGALQTYTVPVGTTVIRIDAQGAQGGSVTVACAATGGLGARMVGDVTVTPGEVLSILVGGQGQTNGEDGGGGGGSFVVRTGNVPLVVAGGGGGASNNIQICTGNRNGVNASITTSGTASANGLIAGGTPGNGGGANVGSGGGGGGFNTDGVGGSGNTNGRGRSYLNGGAGGTGNASDHGGYGGGGCGWFFGGNGGGGGGYAGGGTDGNYPSTYFGGGGGGGSYNIGTNQNNVAGFKTGNGLVVITPLVVAPTATIAQNATIQCFGQSTASLTASVTGGTSPYTYSWAPSGGNAATASGLAAGTYTVTVTDANSATTTQTFNITQPTAIVAMASSTNIACNGGNTGTATAAVTGGTPSYNYLWSNGGTSATINNLTAGVYTYTVTDTQGCTSSQSVTVTQPTALAVTTMQTNVTCNGGNNGDAMVMVSGGTPNYQYSWMPSGGNAATASNLSVGTYTCTITDANGCTATQTVSITEPLPLVASATSTAILCSGDSSTITVSASGGTGPYAGTGVFVVAAGVHIYNISDANGCNTTLFDTITSPDPISVNVVTTDVSCNGGTDGAINLTVGGGTPGYTFVWSNSATTEDLTNLPAGSYTGMVTDANGCMDSGTVVINQPLALVATTTTTNPTTCGGTDGAINASITGGTPAYSYAWSNNATTEDLTGLAAGVYTCTVTDSMGCVSMFAATLGEPNPPAVTFFFQQNTICESDASLALSGSPAGGTFSGPGVTGNTFDPSSLNGAQTVVYTFTDPNTLCTASTQATISVSPCVGINDPASSAMFVNVYPNPNAGIFTIEARSNTGNTLQIEVLNELGQTVQAMTMTSTTKSIDISTLDAGMYFIRVSDGASISMQRIIKQ